MTITISNDSLSAKINTIGAELTSVIKSERQYIWQADPNFWPKHSPILFPIVGTLKNDTYIYDNKEYKMTRHGFAREQEFTIKESSKDAVTFSLQSSETTLKHYPFLFELLVTYTLRESNLDVKYTVINKSEVVLPFSIGGHPAFSLPLSIENYALKFEDDTFLKSYFLKNDLLSEDFQIISLENSRLLLDYSLFERDALIIKSLNSSIITLLENEKPLFDFKFNGFPNFGIWTKPKAPFVCLEPWYGYSDIIDTTQNISEKEGIVSIDKNNRFDSIFSMHIF